METIGIGPTEELRLRVSAAALVRVIFPHPATGEMMLAIERCATLHKNGEQDGVAVTAKPFGGGIRVNQPARLFEHIGYFHFDSPRSKEEQDFRILIRPADWETVQQFCIQEFRSGRSEILENDPVRELAEEFDDTLKLVLASTQYQVRPLEMLVENTPVRTGNVHAANLLTVRVYMVFEALLVDPLLIQSLLKNSAQISDQNLMERAREDALTGGKGRANAVLALPVNPLIKAYLGLPPSKRNTLFPFAGHILEDNVLAVLSEVPVPKYERLSLHG